MTPQQGHETEIVAQPAAIDGYDQQNDLPEIKAEIKQEYRDIAAHVLQDVLRRLHKEEGAVKDIM